MDMTSDPSSKAIALPALPETCPDRARERLSIGKLIVLVLCLLDILDWFLPTDDISTIDDPGRIIPHIGRAALTLLMLGIVLKSRKQLRMHGLFLVQAGWISLILVAPFFVGEFSSQALLNCAIYAMAPLSMWTVYHLTSTGRLDLPFLSRVGTTMALLYSSRILLYTTTGVWIGRVSSDDVIGPLKASGYVLLLFLPLALLGRFKYSRLTFALFALLAATLCTERSTQIEAALGFIILFWNYIATRPRERKRLIAVAVIAVLVFFAAYALNATAINERWSDVQDGDNAGSGRLVFWGILLTNWAGGGTFAHLLGFGPGSVYDATSAEWLAGLVHAHNEWIQILYESGILGLLCYASVMYLVFRISVRLVRAKASGGVAALFATTVVFCRSIFDYFLNSSSAPWYFITIGAALGAATLASSKRCDLPGQEAGQ